MKQNITPVLLLTGYLGSGKTTLLNHILNNQHGIRFAVIVNDIGEVNIDAELIQKGGIVGQDEAGDLVALQNGCICCSLKMDLIKQLDDLVATNRFDYIVIEASGICEPAPIAQTIYSISQMLPTEIVTTTALPRLDCIVTVVDALRMAAEFNCGKDLQKSTISDDDIENLIIEQIEFCDIILLNKISEVSPSEAGRIRQIIRAIQPKARIIECDYANVPLTEIINTNLFNFENVATSATWVKEIETPIDMLDHQVHHHTEHHHEHCHEHCHHHHHDEGEAEEYGIGTYVYFRRQPFNFEKFDRLVNLNWPKNIIRTKGVIYFGHNRDMSLLFEQAGVQKNLKEAGYWYATAPEADLKILMAQEPGLMHDWDPTYGDRMIKLVFIGQHIDPSTLNPLLDSCLEIE